MVSEDLLVIINMDGFSLMLNLKMECVMVSIEESTFLVPAFKESFIIITLSDNFDLYSI
jgi:hypothetical protein